MNAIDDLCHRISSNINFKQEYAELTKTGLQGTLGLGAPYQFDDSALKRLTQAAAIFSQSAAISNRRKAYRIAIGALRFQDTHNGIAEVIRLLFARLGNYPASAFAFAGLVLPKTINRDAFFEIEGHKADNTIVIGGTEAVLTDTQRDVWTNLQSGKSLAFSAPTSAGKSFIFKAFIKDIKDRYNGNDIVYLVPSRALIAQVANDLTDNREEAFYSVITIPVKIESKKIQSPIYVLTPERLQILFYNYPETRFDVVIVDEAHLIADGSRGIILHSALQELQNRNSNAQFLFSSPQVSDPSVFGHVIGQKNLSVLKTKDSPVAQNIILLRGNDIETNRTKVNLWSDGDEIILGEITSNINLYSSADRLIYLSYFIGRASQSLVYANGPGSCEDISKKISLLIQEEVENQDGMSEVIHIPEDISQRRRALSDFAKEAVHSSYPLVQTVLNGVGFHYGKIPSLLRQAVEEEFENGSLNYIVCTSTLLQGVNLPAKNIFLSNPTTGEDHPIRSVDFWNLAGRAGRLGRDFEGNVFLVDYSDWGSAPLNGAVDEPIMPALEEILLKRPEEFVRYIAQVDTPTGHQQDLESAFAKLFKDYRNGQIDQTLGNIPNLGDETKGVIKAALSGVTSLIELPAETLDASPQINGYRQQELYKYMIEKITEKGPEYLLPLHPSGDWGKVINKLRPVFARVHRYLELKPNNTHRYWAPLALRWMRGDPIPVIIDSAIAYNISIGRRRSDPPIIREVLHDLEAGLRFRYVKLIGCYISVLKRALTDSGHENFVSRVPALVLYLELGAASETMVSLMGLGMSRLTASKVANVTINRDMDIEEARRFLRNTNFAQNGLSPFLLREIQKLS